MNEHSSKIWQFTKPIRFTNTYLGRPEINMRIDCKLFRKLDIIGFVRGGCNIQKPRNLYGSVNKFYSNFDYVRFRYMLFNSYCNSFYGAQGWNLRDKQIDKIPIAWNKRHLCKLPQITHTHLFRQIR